MTVRIDRKIVGYQVTGKEESPEAAQAPAAEPAPEPQDKIVQMHEKLERPEMLIGSTYKIKTPLSEHALYVTINDIVLNQAPSTNCAARSRSSSTPRTWTTSSGSWR